MTALSSLSGFSGFSELVEKVNADERTHCQTVDPEIKAAQENLPIFKKKTELVRALIREKVLIVIGDTGSGKSTQLPQYLREIGLGHAGRIACTQLRRVAAKAVAERVAQEQGCNLGEEVGYTIRFDDCTSPKTEIQFMTNGILLRECTIDRTLSSYNAVILDESHERTVDTDVLLGVLRWIIEQRDDLKLIISSATLDSGKFSSYFGNAKVFEISGRMFPVEVLYCPSELNYVTHAAQQVKRINERESTGDIIVFMSGEHDIEELCEQLYNYGSSSLFPELIILPCYSALPWEEQTRIFEPTEAGKRKVIIATNIAETSLTVDGIRYVVDSGWVKQKIYNPRQEREVLQKVKVSQAQAIQRAGRAGRVAPGKCYRLYSKYDFERFASDPVPEIERSSLTNPILLLKKMGFRDLSVIRFIDEPPRKLVIEAENELKSYRAITKDGDITELGRKMASFPVEPNLAKMLVVSESLGCSEEILTIVALLSVPNIFIRPKRKCVQADRIKASFFTKDGDLLTLLNVYNAWLRNDMDFKWCKDNFIHGRFLCEAHNIRQQLVESMNVLSMSVRSAGSNTKLILKSICSGFILNVACKDEGGFLLPGLSRRSHSFQTLPRRDEVWIHPGSALFHNPSSCVVYQKVVVTSKAYMRGLTPVERSWVNEFNPDLKFPPSAVDSMAALLDIFEF